MSLICPHCNHSNPDREVRAGAKALCDRCGRFFTPKKERVQVEEKKTEDQPKESKAQKAARAKKEAAQSEPEEIHVQVTEEVPEEKAAEITEEVG